MTLVAVEWVLHTKMVQTFSTTQIQVNDTIDFLESVFACSLQTLPVSIVGLWINRYLFLFSDVDKLTIFKQAAHRVTRFPWFCTCKCNRADVITIFSDEAVLWW